MRRLPPARPREQYRLTDRGRDLLAALVLTAFLLVMGIVGAIETGVIWPW